jgi:hypothetical protein
MAERGGHSSSSLSGDNFLNSPAIPNSQFFNSELLLGGLGAEMPHLEKYPIF